MNKFICPIAWNDIYNSILNREFLIKADGLKKDCFKDLMPWFHLNRILSEHRLEAPRLRLVKEGSPINQDDYTIEQRKRRSHSIRRIIPQKLYEQLDLGASLVLDAVDELHFPIKDLNSDLERKFGTHIQTNLYLSTCEIRGFDTHWDDHDVLVLQIHGKKKWTVFGETRKHPMYRDLQEKYNPPQNPIWTGIIDEGDILYIPRGFWHHAEALNHPSLHLTVGLNRNTAFNFLEWFQDSLYNQELLRMDLPFPEQKQALAQHYEIVKKHLVEKLESTDFQQFYTYQRGKLKSRPAFGFPLVFKDTSDIEAFIGFDYTLGLSFFPAIAIENDEISFSCNGKEWKLSKTVLSFFELMKDFSTHTYEEIKNTFPDDMGEASINSFIYTLVENGILLIEKRV